MKNYFLILMVHRDQSEPDLREARRKLAFHVHPDRQAGQELEMAELNEAFATLTHGRKKYLIEIDALPKCAECNGRGWQRRQSGFNVRQVFCVPCGGSGRVFP